MPKVFEDSGFTFRFYAADLDEPIHVHVEKDSRVAKFWVSPIELTIPVAIPDLGQVREFAYKLHAQKKSWRGQYQGWPAYYTAEDHNRKPPYSKQTFYPAEFWIGTDRIWTFTIAWEDGAEEEPVELESKYTNGAYQELEEKSSAFFEELRNAQDRADFAPEEADAVTQEAIRAVRAARAKQ